MQSAPDMAVIVNGDDALSAYLAMDSGNKYVTYGISEQVIDDKDSCSNSRISRKNIIHIIKALIVCKKPFILNTE